MRNWIENRSHVQLSINCERVWWIHRKSHWMARSRKEHTIEVVDRDSQVSSIELKGEKSESHLCNQFPRKTARAYAALETANVFCRRSTIFSHISIIETCTRLLVLRTLTTFLQLNWLMSNDERREHYSLIKKSHNIASCWRWRIQGIARCENETSTTSRANWRINKETGENCETNSSQNLHGVNYKSYWNLKLHRASRFVFNFFGCQFDNVKWKNWMGVFLCSLIHKFMRLWVVYVREVRVKFMIGL